MRFLSGGPAKCEGVAALAQPTLRDLLYALDTPSAIAISDHEAYIKGWLVSHSELPLELHVLIGQQRFPVYTGIARHDVARHHTNNALFRHSGFVTYVPLGPEPASARLVASAADTELVLAQNICVPAATAAPVNAAHTSLPLSRRPLVSLLIPLRGKPPYPLVRSLLSIQRQTYPHWQICLIGQRDDSFNALENFFRAGENVVFVESATEPKGEFVLPMGEGDELAPTALEEYVAALEGGADFAYPDECAIDLYGERIVESRKPDFDAEAFASWNFIGNGLMAGRGLDLITRSVARERIRHIPRVLYYTRANSEQQTSVPLADADPGLFPGSVRIRRRLPSGLHVAIVLRPEDGVFQRAALASSLDFVPAHIYTQRPDRVEEDIVIAINGPLESVNHLFLEELVAQAARPDVYVATGLSLDTGGRILHAGLGPQSEAVFGGLSYFDLKPPHLLNVIRSADAIAPFFYAVKREHWNRVKDDPRITAENNLRIIVTPYAIATFDIMSNEAMPQDDRGIAPPAETPTQIASERNYLRRELAQAREALARLEASRCLDLKARIEDLEAQLKTRQQIEADLLNSLSWKVTAPLRACLRLVRGK